MNKVSGSLISFALCTFAVEAEVELPVCGTIGV